MLVIFRTDASHSVGAGHAMRCLALACRLTESGHRVIFVCSTSTEAIQSSILARGCGLLQIDGIGSGKDQAADAKNTLAAINGLTVAPDWVIVDHYELGRGWEAEIRRDGPKVMVIDDLANREHECELLLDTGFCAELGSRYAGLLSALPIILLGPRYSILRNEFTEARTNRTAARKVADVFVSYGGTDPTRETVKALAVASRMPETRFCIVVGSACQGLAEIQFESDRLENVTLHIQSNNIAKLLSTADVALGAGGTSTWERLALGVPAIVTTVAENQVPSIAGLSANGLVEWLGGSEHVSESSLQTALSELMESRKRREEMIRLGQSLVDGRGASRIARALESFDNLPIVRLAVEADAELYYRWTTDPLVRSQSFSSADIPYEDHLQWFKSRVGDRDSRLYVGEINGEPVGQVRLERDREQYTLSYSVDQCFRGRGIASLLLRAALIELNCKPGTTVSGETKLNNDASAHALIAAGFCERSGDGDEKRRFVLEF